MKRFIRKILITLIGLRVCLLSQTLDPPYPRLGAFTFTVARSVHLEASLDIMKDFDIIIMPLNETSVINYKAQNPDRVVLGTNGILYNLINGPEEWYYHDYLGNRIPLFGQFYLMNLTTICPKIDIGDGNGPQRYIDYCLAQMPEIMDFTKYDGVFFDWWWSGPGSKAKSDGDLDMNGVADRYEWGLDSVITVWTDGLLFFHQELLNIPNLKYVGIQGGTTWTPIYPLVNGFCWEDWPVFNGPWRYWRGKYNDTATASIRSPRLMIMDAAHRHFYRVYHGDPYKDNFTAIRFAFASCLFTSAYFYVDEGNEPYPDYSGKLGIGHHGNMHFYDEMEGKGKLGYPISNMINLPGKPLASTPSAEGVWVRFFDHGVSVVNATGMTQSVYASDLSVFDPSGGSSYYRFQGGQDPEFNNGQEVTDVNPLVLWGSTAQVAWNDPEVFGDGAMLFREPDTLITPIIVDNHVNNQTSPGTERIQHIGSWTLTSEGEKFYAFYTGRDYGPFQPDGFAWSAAGSGENVARYVHTIGLNGYYEAFEWHGYLGDSPSDYPNATNVPVYLQYAGGGDTLLTVNQSVNHGQWNSLGVYPFNVSDSCKITLTNQANGYVMADAIKLEFVRGFTQEEEDSLGAGTGEPTVYFSDITSTSIGDTQTGSSACCFADINKDGWPDLYISRYRSVNSTDLCYINLNGITFFEEAAARGVQDMDDGSQGACWGDLDNDGDYDLLNGTTVDFPATTGDHNDMFINDGNGYFTDQTPDSMLATKKTTRSILVFDMEGDGDLDIFSVPGFQGTNDGQVWDHPNEVYRNDGLLAFTKLTSIECGDLKGAQACHGATATDFDNDGDLDIITANQTGDMHILVNDGTGFFTRVSDLAGIGITHSYPQVGTGITMGDVDNDGDLDMLCNTESPANYARLYLNDGDGTFTYSNQQWNDINGYMGGFADLDNDLDLDLVFAGHPKCFLNDGTGHFDEGPSVPYTFPSPPNPRSLAFADIDQDGDPDFVITDYVSKAHLIRNDFNNGNHYLKIKIIHPNGQIGGFGAKVYLYPANQAGGQLLGFREIRSNYGFCGQDDPIVHFGLGGYTAADVVVIFQDGSRLEKTFTFVDCEVIMNGEKAKGKVLMAQGKNEE